MMPHKTCTGCRARYKCWKLLLRDVGRMPMPSFTATSNTNPWSHNSRQG
eukprot:CAMPEP_0179138596 /NCGR_PEP_ID=MMETSP0796-20121207/66206_1 /TAXON_ID=73915 /ORGANISM="Pyrodinium bahamense, Strain pbaha01" /LENGTH=48 /DNA_ID= /DNA_START= /DNA_END= /DNA_ORIENTATION=